MVPDLVLYQYPGVGDLPSISPPCVKVHLALRRLGLAYRTVDLASPRQVKRESPTGRVPVLTIAGRTVVDSVAILDAIEGLGAGRLSPEDPQSRAIDRLWEHHATDTLYWIGFWLRWGDPDHSERMLTRLFGAGLSPARLYGRYVLLPRLRRRARGQGIALRSREDVLAVMERACDLLVDGLAGGPFLGGATEPGRGDLATASLVVEVGFGGTMPAAEASLRRRPALLDHARRTFEACGLVPPEWLTPSLAEAPVPST